MTLLDEPTAPAGTPSPSRPARPPAPAPDVVRPASDPPAPAGGTRLALIWAAITVVSVVLVLVAVGPVSEDRDQRALLTDYRAQIESASNQSFGLAGIEAPTQAPARSEPVAVIDIDEIGVSRVVVEGTDPEQTRQGPGHVVGTGGPGQPGNSVIVGRRGLYGGPFADLDRVETGDTILITTVQGRSLYRVAHVGTHTVVDSATSASADPSPSTTTPTAAAPDPTATGDDPPVGSEGDPPTDPADEPLLPEGTVSTDQLYGPSPDDRLTLVTTASGVAGAGAEAQVVVARMEGTAFAPTPQGGRTPGDDGRSGGSNVIAPLLLALLAYVAAIVGAVWLHRNVPWRSAYLLSVPVVVALAIVLGDTIATMLPAWA